MVNEDMIEHYIVNLRGSIITVTSSRKNACRIARLFSDDYDQATICHVREGEYLIPYSEGNDMLWYVSTNCEEFCEIRCPDDLYAEICDSEITTDAEEYSEYYHEDDGSVEEIEGLLTYILAPTIGEAKRRAFERFKKYPEGHDGNA